MAGAQGRESWRQELKPRLQEILFTGLHHGLLTLLSYTPHSHLSRFDIANNGVDPSTVIINQKNSNIDFPTGLCHSAIFLIKVASSHMVQACIKVEKTNQNSVIHL